MKCPILAKEPIVYLTQIDDAAEIERAARAAGMEVAPLATSPITGNLICIPMCPAHERFVIFLHLQLNTPMPFLNAHYRNAEIIAALSDGQVMHMNETEWTQIGLHMGTNHGN